MTHCLKWNIDISNLCHQTMFNSCHTNFADPIAVVEATFWDKYTASEEYFIRGRVEDGSLEGETRCKGSVCCYASNECVRSEDGEEVRMKALEKWRSVVGWIK